MGDRIVGICRFSFVGRGDWQRFAPVRRGGAVQPGMLDAQAAELFAPERLERRFRAFEALCLPSIAAQRDRDFCFIVLTSPQMPAPWLARLRAAVSRVPMAEVLVSDAPDVGAALADRLTALAAEAPGRGLVQFRLDDDDALAQDFIGNLHGHVARLSDLPAYAVSFMRNLAVTLYPGAPPGFWRFDEPFYAAGLAIKPRQVPGSIFSFGHYGAQARLTHILDTTELGGLILKWPSDSRAVAADSPDERFSRLERAEARALFDAHFPFIGELDFDWLRGEVENA